MPVRRAKPNDLSTIIQLIHGLAEYEREPESVVLDPDELEQHLFGTRPYAEVLIADDSRGDSVGFALFFHNFSTWLGKPGIWLEDLFVVPESRGQGHGFALLSAIARLAVDRDCGRFEWSVLDWNEPSIRFYESLGAEPLDEWTTYRMAGPSLVGLAEGRPFQGSS